MRFNLTVTDAGVRLSGVKVKSVRAINVVKMEYVSALRLLKIAVERQDGGSASSSLQYVNSLLSEQLTSSVTG